MLTKHGDELEPDIDYPGHKISVPRLNEVITNLEVAINVDSDNLYYLEQDLLNSRSFISSKCSSIYILTWK